MSPADSSRAGIAMARWMFIASLGVLALAIVLFFTPARGLPVIDRSATPVLVTPRGDLGEDEKSTVQLFQNAYPSVVHITTLAVRMDAWTRNVLEIPEGTGSGFIWDERGHVVTNFHVIQNADKALVTLYDQSTWEAAVVGIAPDRDLAVLQIGAPQTRLRRIPIGTSRDLQVGQKVFAIGNPFGLDQSLTTGIVSALDRKIESVTRRPIPGTIQTDAAINPGNSGGPLLDSAGRLIGVNAAIYSPSGASAGIGFAIAVDLVRQVIPELIAHGRVVKPILGVQLADDSISRRLGLKGVLVMDVTPGSGAAKAGIRPTRRRPDGRVEFGDVVVAVDGKEVRSSWDLPDALEGHNIGDRVSVTVLRDEKRIDLTIELQAAPRD